MLIVGGPVDSTEATSTAYVELARRAVATSEEQWDEGRMAQLRPLAEGVPKVEVWPLTGTNAELRLEIITSSGKPIAKKLNRQLSRAAELGHVTCLVLDQRGADDLEFGANWLVQHPETVMSALEELEQDAKSRADRVALVRPDNSLIWLRG